MISLSASRLLASSLAGISIVATALGGYLDWTDAPGHSTAGTSYDISAYYESDDPMYNGYTNLDLYRNGSYVAGETGDAYYYYYGWGYGYYYYQPVELSASFNDGHGAKITYRAEGYDDYDLEEVEETHLASSRPFMAFDSITATVSRRGWIKAYGWSADPVTGGLPEKVEALIDGVVVTSSFNAMSRPDVALVYDRPGFTGSGWEFKIFSENLNNGSHSFVVRTTDSNGRVETSAPKYFSVGASYSDNDALDDAWEIANGLDPSDGSDEYADSDFDGVDNDAEETAGTNPMGFNSATTTLGNEVPSVWSSMVAAGSGTEAVGATVGELSVGASGDANYSVPLWITPGTSGMQPELSLNYSSRGGNGLLGHGWSLSGLSAITRGPQTYAVDNKAVGMDFTSTDRFYLDGQRLILVSGTYGANGAEYRTELESFSRIKAHGSSGGLPSWFEVQTKSGLTIQIGNTDLNGNGVDDGNGAARTVDSANTTLSWHVNRITDASGNYMEFIYTLNESAGEHYVSRINYTGTTGTSPSPYASVRFGYVSRSDTSFGYVKGKKMSVNKLLKTVKSYYGETVVRTYTLNYEQQAGPVARSQLSTLVESGMNGDTFKPLVFDYSESYGSEIAWNYSSHTLPKPLNRADKQNGTGFVDVNGDGYPDFVYSRPSDTKATWLNTPSGFTPAPSPGPGASYLLTGYLVDSNGKDQGIRFVDFNGDGLTDYMRGNGGSTSYAYRNTGQGWKYDSSWNLPTFIRGTADPDEAHRHFIDVNGDGRVDFLYNNGSGYKGAYINTGSGWTYSSAWAPPLQNNWANHSIYIDVNGDGLVDQIAHQNDDRWQYGVAINTGSGWTYEVYNRGPINGSHTNTSGLYLYSGNAGSGFPLFKYMPPYAIARYHSSTLGANTLDVYGVETVDMNGDGLSDLVYSDSFSTSSNKTYLNTGDGWTYAYAFNTQIDFGDKGPNRGAAMLDINGDGLPDPTTYEQSTTYRKTQLNTGKGLQSQVSSGLQYYLDRDYGASYGNPGTQMLDVNSDGFVDQIWYRGSSTGGYESKGTYLNRAKPRGLLTSVTNAFGVTAYIDYTPLTERDSSGVGTVYSPSSSALPSGQAEGIGPMYVVEKLEHEDGVGGTYAVEYAYEGMRSDHERGSLGFGKMSVYDTRTRMRSTSTFSHAWPFIGSPVASATEYNESTSDDWRSVSPSNWRLLGNSSVTMDSETFNSGKTTMPFASSSTQNSYDPDSTSLTSPDLLTTTATTIAKADIDGYGNIKKMVVDTGSGFKKTTTSTYYNTVDSTKWILGRLSSANVKAEATGKTTMYRYSGFSYDSKGLLTQERSGQNVGGDPDNEYLVTDYEYDTFGNVVEEIESGVNAGSEARSVTTQYDTGNGRFVLWAQNAEGHQVTTVIDLYFGVPDSVTDPNGLVTTWDYDGFGRVVRQEKQGDDLPSPQTGYDTVVSETRRRWADSNAPASSLYLVESESEGTPPAVQYHDKYGRKTYTYTVGGKSLDADDSARDMSARVVGNKVVYDAQGRAAYGYRPFFLGETHFLSSVTSFDKYGRKAAVAIRDDSAAVGTVVDDPLVNPLLRWSDTILSYDGFDAITVNPLGQKTIVTTDSQGRKTEVVGNADTSLAYEKSRVTYDYDAYGQLVGTTVYNDSVSGHGDGQSHTTTLGYDARGRKVSMSDPNMGSWTYEYNAFGELTKQTDDNGQVITMAYDKLGRMTSKTEVGVGVDNDGDDVADSGASATYLWFYDSVNGNTWEGALMAELGPRTSVEALVNGSTVSYWQRYVRNYEYDSLGRVWKTHQFTDWYDGISTNDYSLYTSEQTYDAHGRPLDHTYPDGFVVRNDYDEYGFLNQVKAQGGYSTLSGEVTPGHVFWEADNYSRYGAIDGQALGNGVTIDHIYDEVTGRLAAIKAGKDGSSSVMDHTYSYDVLGNVRTRDTDTGSYLEYAYDGLNRMKSFGIFGIWSVDNTYDALGNIKTKAGVSGTFVYGQNGAGPNAVTAANNSNYTYDDNGNRLTGGGITIAWDAGNKVKSLTKGTRHALFWQDTNGQRHVQMDSLEGTTHYVGSSYEKVFQLNGVRRKCYIMTPSGRTAVRAVTESGFNGAGVKTRYFHQDNIGSIWAVTDDVVRVNDLDGSAAVERRYGYDAWGEQTETYGATAEEYSERGFTDHEMMVDFGLVHMNGRVYDYKLGRFASADPFIQDPVDSQSYNRYSYVFNNPLTFTDPSGFISFKDIIKIVAIVVISVVTAGAAAAWMGVGNGAIFGSGGALASMGGATIGEIMVAGAAGGFASGFSGSLLNGGSLGDAFKAGVTGAVTGAISAGIANGIGHGFGADWESWQQALAHGASQGLLTAATGGEFKHGFVSGFASKMVGGSVMEQGDKAGVVGRTVAAAVVGGTASALAGGKFANGAISGAFTHLFNEESKGLDFKAGKPEKISGAGRVGGQVSGNFVIPDGANGLVIQEFKVLKDGEVVRNEVEAFTVTNGKSDRADTFGLSLPEADNLTSVLKIDATAVFVQNATIDSTYETYKWTINPSKGTGIAWVAQNVVHVTNGTLNRSLTVTIQSGEVQGLNYQQ